MASLTLKSRHLVFEDYGGKKRFTGWTKACYEVTDVSGSTTSYRTVTAFEPIATSILHLDSDRNIQSYLFDGLWYREGSDMVDMSCVATSKATGGNLVPRL